VKRIFLIVPFLITWIGFIDAHEHWIDLENYRPVQGETTGIFVCSGHYFPKSAAALSERVLCDTKVLCPDGKTRDYVTTEEGTMRSGEFQCRSGGTHLFSFCLKRPPLTEPEYRAVAIASGEGEDGDSIAYGTGEGLEIRPRGTVGRLEKGDTVPLQLLFDGEPVASSLSVSIEGEKNFTLQTSREGSANLPLKMEGRYLVTARHHGKGCSLTFRIGADPRKIASSNAGIEEE
jgi:hypothetical protein